MILGLDGKRWKPFWFKNREEKNRNPPEGNRLVWQIILWLEMRRSVPNLIFLPNFFERYKNSEEKNWNPLKERSRRKCLIHSKVLGKWQGQGKYFTMRLEIGRSVPNIIFLIILWRTVSICLFYKLREENAWNNHQSTEKSGKLFWIVGDRPEYFSVLFVTIPKCLYFPKHHRLENNWRKEENVLGNLSIWK